MRFWNLKASVLALSASALAENIVDDLFQELTQVRVQRRPGETYRIIKCMTSDDSDLATCTSIEEGISYLTQDSKKDALINLGADVCTRVSCSWSSEIQLCNQGDSRNDTSMGSIGRNAQEILDQCKYTYDEIPTYLVRGVLWDMGDSWDMQTYVGWDSC